MAQDLGSRCPYALADYLGIALYPVANFRDLKGMYAWVDGRPCVFVNDNLEQSLQKVVLAHELGHHVLHAELAKAGQAWQEQSLWDFQSRPEYEANLFAVSFLMSDSDFLKLAREEGSCAQDWAAGLGFPLELIFLKWKVLAGRGEVPDPGSMAGFRANFLGS